VAVYALRVSRRIAKRISKYQARGPRVGRTSYKATLSIEILIPPGTLTGRIRRRPVIWCSSFSSRHRIIAVGAVVPVGASWRFR
jgi:hypothetical protein